MGEFTELLAKARAGDKDSRARLFRIAYPSLRRMASALLRRERNRASISASVVVHDAFFKADLERLPFANRAHFFGCFARAMRQMLIDRARSKQVRARCDATTIARILHPQSDGALAPERKLALQNSLALLRELDPLVAETVWLRFAEEYTLSELSARQNRHISSIRRDTDFALRWLAHRLSAAQ